jgi:ABC-type sugar transport system substrate-binding protein
MDKATGNGDIAADVTTDLCGYGTTLGNLATKGKTSGKVAMYTGTPGNPFGGTWAPCAEKAIKAAGLTSTLGNTNWTPQGEAQAAAALSANPGDTVSTVYDYLPDGFFQKYLSLNKQPPTQVGGSAAYSTVELYDKLKAKYPDFTFNVSESQLFFPSIAVTAALEKKLGGDVPLHVVPPQTVLSMSNYLPYFKANPDLPAAAQFSTMLPPEVIKTVLGS